MKWIMTFVLPAFLIAMGTPAFSQEYWEYNEWENQWERHDPIAGLKYEYDNGVEVEEQAYEWEQGEGYHEEEWYDPSDWFDSDDAVDYEDDYNWGYGDGYDLEGYDYDHYYDYTDDFYEDDFFEDDYYEDQVDGEGNDLYDEYDYDYDYSNGLNEEADYTFDQQLQGEVVGMKRIGGVYGKPQSVSLRVRTEDGATREIELGDRAYADRFLPNFSKGDRVVIGGERVNVSGRNMFRAKELRSGVASYRIPAYEYEQRIEGEILGLRQVRVNDGQIESVVASVKPENGVEMDVLLGTIDAMRRQATTVRPGAEIRVDGYSREVDGQRTFVVQDVKVVSKSNKNINSGGEDRMASDSRPTNDSNN